MGRCIGQKFGFCLSFIQQKQIFVAAAILEMHLTRIFIARLDSEPMRTRICVT